MGGYGPSTYGERIADFYDELVGLLFAPAATEQFGLPRPQLAAC